MEDSIIVGRNPVKEALERGDAQIIKVMIQKGVGGRPVEEIRRIASKMGIPVQYVPAPRLTEVAGGLNHQGIVALSTPVQYQLLEEMLAGIASNIDEVRARNPIILLLDQIEDPHNFGAILRSAVAFAINGVVVPKHHMAPVNAAAIKASAGAALRIPIARVTSFSDTIIQMKERGYWVVGAAGEGATPLSKMDWARPLAIIIGNEGKGLRQKVAESCDYLISIPMRGPTESLNASVAAGIILYTATEARGR